MDINLTILGQAIMFVLFVWFCMKFVWPPLSGAIEKRQKEIASGLANAEKAKKETDMAQVSAQALIDKAKADAQQIIEQANKRKTVMVEEAKMEAEKERANILAQAQAEIASQQKRVREELRKQVALLAVAGAEKIIERSVDEAANSDIIDKIVAEL